jgi:hypothetical protein
MERFIFRRQRRRKIMGLSGRVRRGAGSGGEICDRKHADLEDCILQPEQHAEGLQLLSKIKEDESIHMQTLSEVKR